MVWAPLCGGYDGDPEREARLLRALSQSFPILDPHEARSDIYFLSIYIHKYKL